MDEAAEDAGRHVARDRAAGKELQGGTSGSERRQQDAPDIEAVEARPNGNRQSGEGNERDQDARQPGISAFHQRRGQHDRAPERDRR